MVNKYFTVAITGFKNGSPETETITLPFVFFPFSEINEKMREYVTEWLTETNQLSEWSDWTVNRINVNDKVETDDILTGYNSSGFVDWNSNLCYLDDLERKMVGGYLFVDAKIVHSFGYSNCENITEITIGPNVEYIANGAFANLPNLKSVRFVSDKITEISERTFMNCKNLKRIALPVGITEIGKYAFADCENLKEIAIPYTTTRIGEYAFRGCSSIESIYIPEGVVEIADNAFLSCYRLNYVKFPNSIRRIGKDAFSLCDLNVMEMKLKAKYMGQADVDYFAFYFCWGGRTLKDSNLLKL